MNQLVFAHICGQKPVWNNQRGLKGLATTAAAQLIDRHGAWLRLRGMKHLWLLFLLCASSFAASPRPNIVFLICDDLGYGDVHCLNPEHGKIATPGADRLAAQGIIFTDAHSGSSVCTPMRYGVMTGRSNCSEAAILSEFTRQESH